MTRKESSVQKDWLKDHTSGAPCGIEMKIKGILESWFWISLHQGTLSILYSRNRGYMLSLMIEVDPWLLLSLCVLYEIQNQIFQHIPSFFFFNLFDINCVWCFSACLSLSLFLSISCSMAPKWKSTSSWNPPRLRHHLLPLPILPLLMSGSVMIKPVRTFWRTFHNATFIRNAKSFYRTFLILTFPLSSTVGVRSHCVALRSLVLLWSYRRFTPTCTDLTILYLISLLTFGVRIL